MCSKWAFEIREMGLAEGNFEKIDDQNRIPRVVWAYDGLIVLSWKFRRVEYRIVLWRRRMVSLGRFLTPSPANRFCRSPGDRNLVLRRFPGLLTALFFSKFGCDEFLNSDREKFSEFGSLSESESETEMQEADAIKVEGISRRYAHTTQFLLASIWVWSWTPETETFDVSLRDGGVPQKISRVERFPI